MRNSHFVPARRISAVALAVSALIGAPAQAFQFTSESGEVKGAFDTNITYGAMWRVGQRDLQLVGLGNGGLTRSVGDDDGNLNYDRGSLVSSLFKVSHDLSLNYHNVGMFARALYFYDSAIHDMENCGIGSTTCAKGLLPEAKDRLGDDVQLLDAYVFGRFDLGEHKLNARFGNQVVNWGESTFIPNGINAANPVDVARLRAPGSEVKEGLLPVPMLWSSLEVSDTVSLEGFYQFNFQKTKIDPRGSYFSNNDFLSPGGDRGYFGGTGRYDQHQPFVAPGTIGPDGYPIGQLWVTRNPDLDARDSGQFGLAARVLAPQWNNTEFGLFFMNYHSRTPFLSGISGGNTTKTAVGLILADGPTGQVGGTTNPAPGLMRAMSEFPEDIQMYGLSFNTAGPLGMAIQGEYSYRPNQPVQLASLEVLLGLLGLANRAGVPIGPDVAPAGTYVRGYREVQVHQLQVTATKSFGPQFGAGQVSAVVEVGGTYMNLPSDLLFAGPGTNLPAMGSNVQLTAGANQPNDEGYATRSSWGYRVLVNASYSNAIGAATMIPRVVFTHDVHGVSPSFNEGTKALSLGVGFNYKQNWQADLAYTAFFGGRTYSGSHPNTTPGTTRPDFAISANPLKDRDFISASLSYSF
jgi:hypothetical protein